MERKSISILTPSEGKWLYNGDVFSQEVTTLTSREDEWQEVTDEYKTQWEEEHQSDEPTEGSTE